MIVHNSSHIQRPHFQAQNVPASNGSVSASASTSNAANAPTINTDSMENLLALVAGGEEVREQLVANIKLKIQTGQFLTQAAAVQTADAILNL